MTMTNLPTSPLRLALLCGVVAVGLCIASCGGPAYDYSKEPDPRRNEYVIGIADGLRINVWKNPELSTQVSVRPDGTITMPLIGDIFAFGRTVSQLTGEISSKLKAYVKEEGAIVSIAVTDVNSYRFTVSGNAERPGVFELKYFATVADALARAGGINKFGSEKKMLILRLMPNGGVRKIPINFDRISRGDHPEENLVLLPGDTLFIP